MPTLFRVMTPDGDKPAVGRSGRKLGVRLLDAANPDSVIDITPDANGLVGPAGEGMSVSPDFKHLPVERVPKRLRKHQPGARGRDSDKVWRHGTGPFEAGPVAPGLALHPDHPGHGVVQPAQVTQVERYEQALAATAEEWMIDEP